VWGFGLDSEGPSSGFRSRYVNFDPYYPTIIHLDIILNMK
jgi:hypothetical protein